MDPERMRLQKNREKKEHWRKWGPYLSERQWGTVREDYSPFGTAWQYFPFDQSAMRTYRWGEDGIGGFSDNHQRLCFSFVFWNARDDILKERLYGLAGEEGNHGEDVKELYYYLDGTPTHSYMRYLYKYPQNPYPYQVLLKRNKRRSLKEDEYELLDTGVFSQKEYFDLFIRYAKQGPEDLFIELLAKNRSAKEAPLHILPTLWFRNTWSWTGAEKTARIENKGGMFVMEHPTLGRYHFYAEKEGTPLFTENESNTQKLFQIPNKTPYVKDAFHEYIIHSNKEAVNPKEEGTKAAIQYIRDIPPKGEVLLRFRLTKEPKKTPFAQASSIFVQRQEEMEVFFHPLVPKHLDGDTKNILHQAFSSLLWAKQFYHYVVETWLEGDDKERPPPLLRKKGRNYGWEHLFNDDILSIPDKWEYPWFASWDTAFQMIPYALLDAEFAKNQLMLFTREWYMHPNGQIPAYEWNFSDVNPPVHAWAAWRVYKIEQKWHQEEDRVFLASIFQKLLLNFTWWVNRKDSEGKNVFQGGFLGLDNISIFDRSEVLPMGGSLSQSDATSWMAMYSLNMLVIAMELAPKEPSYEDMASKFFEHFLHIADAMNYEQKEVPPLWDEKDGFFYDVLHLPSGEHLPIRVRSMVGIIPLFAVATIEKEKMEALHGFQKRFDWFLSNKKRLCKEVASINTQGKEGRYLLSILNRERLEKVLEKVLDENEFLSPYGIRSVSYFHKDHPYTLELDGAKYCMDYEPGVSHTKLFGGNSNWRGPIWFPLNFLIIESLQKFHHYYGDDLKVAFPTGSSNKLTLWEVAREISKRLVSLFQKEGPSFERPIFRPYEQLQEDPDFQDYLFFHEYFHPEEGRGLGASHQTGWTSIVAKLIVQYGEST